MSGKKTNKCRFCNAPITIHKIACNKECTDNYLETTQIQFSHLYIKRIAKLNFHEREEEYLKYSKYHNYRYDLVKKLAEEKIKQLEV